MNVRHPVARCLFLGCYLVSTGLAQDFSRSALQPAPKREFRGAWIATVTNIDWPASNAQTAMSVLLDSLKNVGINAIFFQVRPSCDAFYASSIEPWSEWLTGTQGQAPNPLFDPLQFMIDACRSRGMEIHAWFNPYRAVLDTTRSNISGTHVSVLHPDWLLTSGTLKILNPGLPEVRAYVTNVIMDVVRRYDIDGVHFDDYFYPYGGIGDQDKDLWLQQGATLPIGDWRRENVNAFIRTLRDSINGVKPRIKFGVSPFGIWRNQSSDANGSATNGNQSYDVQYADTRRWLQEGWVDYMAPQVYWPFAHRLAPYGILASWWDANAFSRHVYIGQATYRAVSTQKADSLWSVQELINQIDYNRSLPNILGSIHFSAKYFGSNTRLLNDSLRLTVYPRITGEAIPRVLALLPTMAWKDAVPPLPPDSFRIDISTYGTYAFVRWKAPSAAPDGDLAQQYLLYRSMSLPIDFSDLRNVVAAGSGTQHSSFTPPVGNQVYYYAATSLDRHQNESAPTAILGWSTSGVVNVQEPAARPQGFTLSQNFPNPFNPTTIIQFSLGARKRVSLRVYDILGREISVLYDDAAGPGTTQVVFDGRGLPSGVYFYRLVTEGRVETKKMQLVK